MRGSRPSPSAKLARRVCSSAWAAFSLTDLGLAEELLELGPDDVHVDRHAGVLEGEQADPHGPLDEVRAVVGRALGEERGERRVRDDEPVDDDPVALDPDARRRPACRRRSTTVSGGGRFGGFHGPNDAPGP